MGEGFGGVSGEGGGGISVTSNPALTDVVNYHLKYKFQFQEAPRLSCQWSCYLL